MGNTMLTKALAGTALAGILAASPLAGSSIPDFTPAPESCGYYVVAHAGNRPDDAMYKNCNSYRTQIQVVKDVQTFTRCVPANRSVQLGVTNMPNLGNVLSATEIGRCN